MQSARTGDTALDSVGLEDLVLAMARGDEGAVMARNRAIDRLRQRRQSLSLDDEQHEALAASLVTEAPSAEHLLNQIESGDAEGLPLGTVKSHVRRSLAKLKGQLRNAPAGFANRVNFVR